MRENCNQFIEMDVADIEAAATGGQGHHRRIDRIGLQKPQNIVRIAGLHDDFDTRHGLTDFGQHGRQQIDAGSCARADAQASRHPAAMRCYGIDRMRHFFRNPPCMDEKIPARRRRLRAPADPFDQPHAELFFEKPDMQTDGGLRQAGCVIPALSAAAEKLPRSATSMKLRTCRRSRSIIKENLIVCIR
ncbi:hypothetical protein D3C71_903010 [compost metagenome]